MEQMIYGEGCPGCGEYDCLCVDPDEPRDRYDDPCEECERWGRIQCRVHGQDYGERRVRAAAAWWGQ